MNIAYQLPSLATVYAYRTIHNGYKNAFITLGHNFHTFTQEDDLKFFLEKNNINIFITSSHFYYQKFLDLELLSKYRKKGMLLLTKVDYWNSPFSKLRINEAPPLKEERDKIIKIQNGLLGDIFFHTVGQFDYRMQGFTKGTGKQFITIPLASDTNTIYPEFSNKYIADISYIGTNLPEKQKFFRDVIFPLKEELDVRFYGQDWTLKDKMLGIIQKIGQYYNLPYLKKIQKPKLQLSDERKIYNSSQISINVHEEYQRIYGGDCNERTFKIPAAGGFEIVDDVECISQYFEAGKEIVIAKNKMDWLEKIEYYLKNPQKKQRIVEAGRKRVLSEHTYVHRARQILNLYEKHNNN